MLTLIKNSAANLRGHKLRLVIAFTWIIIGITSVVFVSAMGNAMSSMFKSTFKSLAPNTAVIYYENKSYDSNSSTTLIQPFVKSDLQIIQAIEGVEKVEVHNKPLTIAPGTRDDAFYGDAKYFDKSTSLAVIDPSDTKYKIIKGRAISESDEGSRVAVIPDQAAKDLFDEESPIGKGIELNKVVYQIVGVSDSKKIYDATEKKFRDRTNFDSAEYYTVVPKTSFLFLSGKLAQSNDVQNIKVTVNDGENLKAVTDKVIESLNTLHPNLSNGEYKVHDQSSIQKATQAMTKGIDKFVRIITIISMVVGGVGIMNIMYVSVMERGKEIGIRRALGAKPRTILFQFLVESVFITSVGGVMGVIVGYAITMYSRNYLPIKPVPSFNSFLYSFIAIVLTGIIFGLVPAYKASKLDPIKIIYK